MNSSTECKHILKEETRPALRAKQPYEYARKVCTRCGFSEPEVLRKKEETPPYRHMDAFEKIFLLMMYENKRREEEALASTEHAASRHNQ